MKRASGIAIVAAAALFATAPAGGANDTCSPTIEGTAVHYCGPAKAHLGKFPKVTFKRGSCEKHGSGASQLFTVKLGVRTQDAKHNDGKRYFGLSVSGRFKSPSGGGVIAYSKGKRWGGKGVSFDGNAKRGHFVAKGINGSKGKTKGRYRC